ncbi:MAG: DinB family protein [Rubricoccaceae bacterium]
MISVSLLQQTRPLFLRLTNGLAEDDLLAVPEGFNNNILWNLGHVVVTQQLLHYGLSNLPLLVPDELVAQCRKGTSPADWDTPPDLDEIRRLMTELPRQLETDLAASRFTEFRPYMTSVGVELADLETALSFNQYHEGLHTGAILALRRAVRTQL